jgi:hypothetical protein
MSGKAGLRNRETDAEKRLNREWTRMNAVKWATAVCFGGARVVRVGETANGRMGRRRDSGRAGLADPLPRSG